MEVNQIICGDWIEISKKIPSESVGLIVTSPPYNLRNSTGNGMKDGRGGKWSNSALLNGYSNYNDNMPHDKYVKWQRACLTEMMRIIPENGAIFYNHKNRVQSGRIQDRNDILKGFPVRQIITWKRSGGINFNDGYFLPTTEQIYLITKNKFKLKQGANILTDIWDVPQERGNSHPAPFPIKLAENCISSTESKLILDPFLGSGTTAIAAIKLGREYLGIDISKKYCLQAKERIKEYKSSMLK